MHEFFNFSCFLFALQKTMRTEYKIVSTSCYLWLLFLAPFQERCKKNVQVVVFFIMLNDFLRWKTFSCKLKFHKQALKEETWVMKQKPKGKSKTQASDAFILPLVSCLIQPKQELQQQRWWNWNNVIFSHLFRLRHRRAFWVAWKIV